MARFLCLLVQSSFFFFFPVISGHSSVPFTYTYAHNNNNNNNNKRRKRTTANYFLTLHSASLTQSVLYCSHAVNCARYLPGCSGRLRFVGASFRCRKRRQSLQQQLRSSSHGVLLLKLRKTTLLVAKPHVISL